MKNKTDDKNKGAHPVGTSIGAASGAVAGAAVGTAAAGPAGTLVGGAVGAAAGALAGQGVAEAIDAEAEEAYWRDHYRRYDYVDKDRPYSDYGPAYQYGWESRSRMRGRSFDDVESDLAKGWNNAKRQSRLTWEQAKQATRDAWHRVEKALPGDFDGDGR